MGRINLNRVAALFESSSCENRTRSLPIRTTGEITAHISIRPAIRTPLYQKIAPKVTELRLLGMPYQEIAKALQVSKTVAKRAGHYGKGA